MTCKTVLGLVVVAALSAGCSSGPSAPDEGSFLQEIAAARVEKDQNFNKDPESPIPANKRDTLLPLPYYPPDPVYAVPAVLKVADNQPVFEMPTSTGTLRRYRRVGVLEFTVQGHAATLAAFVPEESTQIDELFVPFADTTTGNETYSAGRYLNLLPTATGLYTIDFNSAYNPYCAYNARYECPYPPPSNRLKLAIRAGEKMPKA